MKSNYLQCKRILLKNGVFLNNNRLPKIKEDDLSFLKSLIETKKIKPIIDRNYSFDQMAKAHEYVDTGRKKGNVTITVNVTT